MSMQARRIAALSIAVMASAMLASTARADPARDAILADLLAGAKAADAAFSGFSAARGEALFRAKQTGGDPEANACTACHGANPTQAGENVKTGKLIEPMAVSANPKRYTNADDVEKWFRRNCKEVLGRECTPVEKGDFISFMATQ
jgi:mono/diheme cytochrome c family protein